MENVNDIINNLCEKLGTTIEYIVPEYAKMKIVNVTMLRCYDVTITFFSGLYQKIRANICYPPN